MTRTRHTPSMNRRSFVQASLIPAALPFASSLLTRAAPSEETPAEDANPGIIDCNVHLFEWPFRKLRYDHTDALVAKLRKHRITQAWAGSFHAALHKRLDDANRELAEECRVRGGGMLRPMGSVNPAWPDWEEDLRRCQEQHGMRGIRLYPNYHGYALDHPEFARLLNLSSQRGLLVQIAIRMEDDRVHHPTITAPNVNVAPLAEVLKKAPAAKVQLLNSGGALLGPNVAALVRDTSVTFDIAATEGNGGVGRLLEGKNPSYRGAIPIERLVFGSHAPYFPCESALLKLFESPMNHEQLEKLMSGNARQLINSV